MESFHSLIDLASSFLHNGKMAHMTVDFNRPAGWIRWIPALVIMALIFLFSSIPAGTMPVFAGIWDLLIKKGGHILAYGALAIAIRFGLRDRVNRLDGFAWVLAVLYASTDEFHQSFVPGRGATLIDVGIDALGAWLGLWLWGWLNRRGGGL
jgi:VanZ family protein